MSKHKPPSRPSHFHASAKRPNGVLVTEHEPEEGEPDRMGFGIDGTKGDAQDVDHPFLGSVHGDYCRVCGLARSYRRHKDPCPAAGGAS
jgi:hypothetical protein